MDRSARGEPPLDDSGRTVEGGDPDGETLSKRRSPRSMSSSAATRNSATPASTYSVLRRVAAAIIVGEYLVIRPDVELLHDGSQPLGHAANGFRASLDQSHVQIGATRR
jgi:hypothetical protein